MICSHTDRIAPWWSYEDPFDESQVVLSLSTSKLQSGTQQVSPFSGFLVAQSIRTWEGIPCITISRPGVTVEVLRVFGSVMADPLSSGVRDVRVQDFWPHMYPKRPPELIYSSLSRSNWSTERRYGATPRTHWAASQTGIRFET